MLKNLKIPVIDENTLSISDVTPDYNGLIIGYKDNKPVGYVTYLDYDGCVFTKDANATEGVAIYREINLNSLIKKLVKDNYCDNFKVLMFE